MSDAFEGTGVFRSVHVPAGEAAAGPEIRVLRSERASTEMLFAREQIRGLVRQIFFANAVQPVRQIVISAMDSETDVRTLCRSVGHALSLETAGRVVVAGCDRETQAAQHYSKPDFPSGDLNEGSARGVVTPVRSNFWLMSLPEGDKDGAPDARLHGHLCQLRREFDYSIVAGPPAGSSNAAIAMGQLADGLLLVLSAQHTRRAAARHTKEILQASRVRILGTVLADRTFPIPEALYRRL